MLSGSLCDAHEQRIDDWSADCTGMRHVGSRAVSSPISGVLRPAADKGEVMVISLVGAIVCQQDRQQWE